jgi:hypothetical protein
MMCSLGSAHGYRRQNFLRSHSHPYNDPSKSVGYLLFGVSSCFHIASETESLGSKCFGCARLHINPLLARLCPTAISAYAQEAKATAPQVVLAETYNAVTSIFTNTAVHKGSHKPGLVERRFRADVKYWLMDAKYYEHGMLSVGNPPLVDLVRKLGSKNLPESEPTALSAMAYEIARGVLEQYPIMQRIEVRLIHFSRGLDSKDEAEDNHVVNLVLQR